MNKKIHEHFKANDPILYEYIRKIRIGPLILPANLFERLVRSIIGQQLSVKAAATIFNRLVELCGEVTPDTVLALKPDELRACGISYSKIRGLKDLAEKVKNGTIELEKLKELEEEEVIERLCKIRGIGRWTAEMFLLFSLGREDIYSHGDTGLVRAIQTIYGFKKPPTRKQTEKIIRKWSPYKSFASRILWSSLDNTPK